MENRALQKSSNIVSLLSNVSRNASLRSHQNFVFFLVVGFVFKFHGMSHDGVLWLRRANISSKKFFSSRSISEQT